MSIPDPAAEEDNKLGSALGCDPLLLQQEKLDRPPSIKLAMVADLSHLQTAQDDSVKPSMSNTLEIGKFPGIPPHKGSWYSVVDDKFAQTPQVVPQTFSNIAKPGYRSGPPASVRQKDLVKLEYMTRENISIANFLSTFGMASESCLNNLRLSRDQRERLFDQFRATTDGPSREQIMLQLFTMTQQESSQMQFMLDISRSMSKAYADLVSNFLSTLTNLVLLRRDAYLHHAHPNLDAFRVRNLCIAPVSGGDLFERSLMQEYEQNLIGLGVKPGSKKEQRRTDNAFRGSLTLCFPCSPSRGGEDSECAIPTGEGKDTVCTVPTGGKIPCVQSPPEGEKTLGVQSQDISNLVQKCIYSRKSERSASGGQTKAVPFRVEKTWVPPVDHRAHKRQIQVSLQGTPKPIQGTLHNQQLCRLRQAKCLMALYSRPAAERRSRSRSYPRKSGILQLSLPGTKTRQSLEASHRLKFTKQIPGHSKVQDGDPRVHTCLPQERGMGHIYRSHRRLRTYSHPVSKIPQVSFQRRHLPVHQPPIWASNSPPHFHLYSQTDSFAIRNQTPPIPG